MKHEYNSKEVAAMFGLNVKSINRYIHQGVLKPADMRKGRGRGGITYIFDDDSIQKLSAKIGIEPVWDASGRTYSNTPAPAEEPEEEPTILHEWVVIQLGEMFLTDNMSLTDSMDKAKRWGTEARDSIRQHSQRTGGKPMLVQTIVKPMTINESE